MHLTDLFLYRLTKMYCKGNKNGRDTTEIVANKKAGMVNRLFYRVSNRTFRIYVPDLLPGNPYLKQYRSQNWSTRQITWYFCQACSPHRR